MADNGSQSASNDHGGEDQGQARPPSKPLNIKVTDNNNEVFFLLKHTTPLGKLMAAFCVRQGKTTEQCRFLFDGRRVIPTDTPESLEMEDGDRLEVHQEQIGGS